MLAHGVIDGLLPPVWETARARVPAHRRGARLGDRRDRPLRATSSAASASTATPGRCWRIPHPAWPMPAESPDAGLPAGRLVVGSFGHLNPAKRVPQLLEASRCCASACPRRCCCSSAPSRPALELELPDDALHFDYVAGGRLWSLLAATRHLRQPPLPDDGRDLRGRRSRAGGGPAARSSATSAGSRSYPTRSRSRFRSATTRWRSSPAT